MAPTTNAAFYYSSCFHIDGIDRDVILFEELPVNNSQNHTERYSIYCVFVTQKNFEVP